MGRIQNKLFSTKILSLIAVAALCSACGGGMSYKKVNSGSLKHDGLANNNSSGGGSGGPSGGSGGGSNGGGSSGSGGLLDPYEFLVEGVGHDDFVEFEVPASEKLKIRFKPGIQYMTVEGTGYSPGYGKLAVFFKINDDEDTLRPTFLMNNGWLATAQQSAIENYTTYVTNPENNSTGMVTVGIGNANYDHYCLFFGVCNPGWTWVHTTHPWNGTLYVETEATTAL